MNTTINFKLPALVSATAIVHTEQSTEAQNIFTSTSTAPPPSDQEEVKEVTELVASTMEPISAAAETTIEEALLTTQVEVVISTTPIETTSTSTWTSTSTSTTTTTPTTTTTKVLKLLSQRIAFCSV